MKSLLLRQKTSNFNEQTIADQGKRGRRGQRGGKGVKERGQFEISCKDLIVTLDQYLERTEETEETKLLAVVNMEEAEEDTISVIRLF